MFTVLCLKASYRSSISLAGGQRTSMMMVLHSKFSFMFSVFIIAGKDYVILGKKTPKHLTYLMGLGAAACT